MTGEGAWGGIKAVAGGRPQTEVRGSGRPTIGEAGTRPPDWTRARPRGRRLEVGEA